MIFARGESTDGTEQTDINTLVAQVTGTQRRTSSPPQLTLGYLPEIPAHRQALTRALANLLDNARKYGGDPISVETRVENQDLLIDVLDRGPGIPEGEIERLKRPFTRLENARTDASGTGLGLAIVERIARLHEGRFELLQREGGGLIARLRIPLKQKT